jgi:hypothetical protein
VASIALGADATLVRAEIGEGTLDSANCHFVEQFRVEAFLIESTAAHPDQPQTRAPEIADAWVGARPLTGHAVATLRRPTRAPSTSVQPHKNWAESSILAGGMQLSARREPVGLINGP